MDSQVIIIEILSIFSGEDKDMKYKLGYGLCNPSSINLVEKDLWWAVSYLIKNDDEYKQVDLLRFEVLPKRNNSKLYILLFARLVDKWVTITARFHLIKH